MKSYIEFRQEVCDNKTSCLAEAKNILNRIGDNKDNYFIQVDKENILSISEDADNRFQEGKPRKLEGMFIGVKDNISVKGMKSTCASKMLSTYQPMFDATVISRIKSEGGIIVGKTNMDELAMGSSNETSFFGSCKNPINNDYITGGSSGGSAAAVASGMAHIALGSDTGGSIRQPAAFCGDVGFKPTYGRLSRNGLIAFASSLDQIGTLSSNIDDTAILFDVMSGIDDFDSTTANLPPTNTFENINEPIPNKFKIGLLPDNILQNCSEEVLNEYSNVLNKLKLLGAEFQTLGFDFIDVCVPTYIVLTTSEASSNLARLDGIRYGHRANITNENISDYVAVSRGEGFGIEVKRRLLVGTYFLTNDNNNYYYKKARKIRTMIKNSINEAFQSVDLFFMPTTATTAFKANEKTADPVAMYLSDFFTTSANLSGIPAISVPTGFAKNGLPIGMQLQANSWEEEKLFKFAKLLMN